MKYHEYRDYGSDYWGGRLVSSRNIVQDKSATEFGEAVVNMENTVDIQIAAISRLHRRPIVPIGSILQSVSAAAMPEF
jgi:hypothetical protein